jgi:hypothetical protein
MIVTLIMVLALAALMFWADHDGHSYTTYTVWRVVCMGFMAALIGFGLVRLATMDSKADLGWAVFNLAAAWLWMRQADLADERRDAIKAQQVWEGGWR